MIKIGHRGAAGYEPENTLLSFKKALELNVDMIELDVNLCKTGELIVIHDNRLDRTTNGHGLVSKKTLKELKNLDAGKGEKIPILKEVLDLINKKTKVNIELKGRKTAKPTSDLIKKYIRNGWSRNHFLVSSFNKRELKEFRKLNPIIPTSVLVKKVPLIFNKFLKNSHSIGVKMESISKTSIKRINQKRLKVYVYTVNKLMDIKKMKKLGVDGIFSDFPDRL